MQSRVENSARNIVYRIGSQLITIAIRFISRSIFISILGATYLGVEGLFSSILQMLSLSDLGLSTVMVFSMYKPLADQDEEKLTALVNFYKKIYTIIACVVLVIGIALMPFLKYLVNLDSEMPHIYLYYFLYLLNTVASYLVVYKTSILNADQKNYIISRYDAIFGIVSMIATTVLLIITRSFLAYLIITVVMTYAKNLWCSHVASKQYPYINNRNCKLKADEQKGIFSNIKSGFIYKLSLTLISSTDNTLISVMLGTIYVGYYSNYSMIVNNVSFLINMIFSSITASIGNLITYGDKKKNYQVYKTMHLMSFILCSVVISCVFILASDFVALWVGSEYVLSLDVVLAITINLYFSIILMPIWSYREATGMFKRTKYVMLCTAIVNLVCSIALGRFMGLAGIIFATSIARLTTYFWYEPRILFKEYFDESVRIYYIKIFLNIFITIIACLAAYYITSFIDASTWLMWIVKAILGGLTSGAIVGLCYCRSAEMKDVLVYIKTLLRLCQ